MFFTYNYILNLQYKFHIYFVFNILAALGLTRLKFLLFIYYTYIIYSNILQKVYKMEYLDA